MLEKVYCIHDYWDMIPVSGVAEYKGGKYYFTFTFDRIKDEWSDEYDLKYLSDEIFELELENWRYWSHLQNAPFSRDVAERSA
jgi:hypothetical protein